MAFIWHRCNLSLCNIPFELLKGGERLLIERKGKKGDYSERLNFGYYNVRIEDFPSIFYSEREVKIGDVYVPIYVQALLRGLPIDNVYFDGECSDGRRSIEEEVSDFVRSVKVLQRDLEEFPLELFYEHLFRLRGIDILEDNKTQYCAYADFDTNSVNFSTTFLRQNYFDFDHVAVALLHELYHFVERQLGEDRVKRLFDGHERWELTSGSDYEAMFKNQKKYLPISNIIWEDGVRVTKLDHLAEILAALTYIRHPEVLEEIRPHDNSLKAQENPQLPLFHKERQKIWYVPQLTFPNLIYTFQ